MRASNGDRRHHQNTKEPRAHTIECDTVQRGKCTTRGSSMPATGCRTASCGAPTTAGVESAARTSHLIREPVSAKKLARHVPSSSSSVKTLAQHKARGRISVQNSPSSLEMSHFRLLCVCRANFVSLTPTSLRAGRNISRRLIETAEHGAFSLTLGITTSLD